jgi:hypothetical protein
MADRLENQAPHADTDPRRRPDPDRSNMPEGLRRTRKPAYGPSGRHDEKVEPENSRHAKNRQIAEDE